MMPDRPIVIADATARMLRGLLAARMATRHDHDQEHLQELGVELDRALVLAPGEMPANVVTLGAVVRVLDLRSGERQEVVLVRPAEADVKARRISVLAPLERRYSAIEKATRSSGSCRVACVVCALNVSFKHLTTATSCRPRRHARLPVRTSACARSPIGASIC